MERETGFGPATLSLGRGRALPAPACTEPQLPVKTASDHFSLPHLAHQAAASSPKFADTLADALEVRSSVIELTVREVARRLRVSTATVYALCHRGELEHHRVSNAIRIPETALARYLASASITTSTGATDPEWGS
jgi:excisionase family DNA binding protein